MIIGLTGGIGSGKTTVGGIFRVMGFAVYNSDDRAKEMYYEAEVKSQILDLFGAQAYLPDGGVNRTYIAQQVFGNPELLNRLNGIIHPAVKNDFEVFVKKHAGKPIIKETALLFEAGIYKQMDVTILVTAPLDLKVERVMKRSGLSRNEVLKRMGAQWTDEEKGKLAIYTIVNDGRQALIPQVLEIISSLKHNAKA